MVERCVQREKGRRDQTGGFGAEHEPSSIACIGQRAAQDRERQRGHHRARGDPTHGEGRVSHPPHLDGDGDLGDPAPHSGDRRRHVKKTELARAPQRREVEGEVTDAAHCITRAFDRARRGQPPGDRTTRTPRDSRGRVRSSRARCAATENRSVGRTRGSLCRLRWWRLRRDARRVPELGEHRADHRTAETEPPPVFDDGEILQLLLIGPERRNQHMSDNHVAVGVEEEVAEIEITLDLARGVFGLAEQFDVRPSSAGRHVAQRQPSFVHAGRRYRRR